MTTDAALLELVHVSKIFPGPRGGTGTVAVEDVSLRIEDGGRTTLAVAGESGSGKTVLSRMVLGLTPPTGGRVLFRGSDLARASRATRTEFRRRVQPIFQDPYEVYNPVYRVDHALETPVRRFGLAGSRTEERRLIEGALEVVGLRASETLGRFPHELSGGQRQRLMVARAILVRPQLIVADEPVSMVDASLRATILGEINSLRASLGVSVLYITHDLTTAYQLCDRLMVMYRGAVVEQGPIDQVIDAPAHPYTQLLVGSIPRLTKDEEWAQQPVGGQTPPGAPPGGCRFAPRCPAVMERCRTESPAPRPVDERAVACHLYPPTSTAPLPSVPVAQ